MEVEGLVCVSNSSGEIKSAKHGVSWQKSGICLCLWETMNFMQSVCVESNSKIFIKLSFIFLLTKKNISVWHRQKKLKQNIWTYILIVRWNSF